MDNEVTHSEKHTTTVVSRIDQNEDTSSGSAVDAEGHGGAVALPMNNEVTHSEKSTTTVVSRIDQNDDRNEPPVKKTKFKHKFQGKWLQENAWMNFENGKMFCTICKEQGKDNALSSGCTNFRTSTLKRHIQSSDHTKAVREHSMHTEFQQASVNALTKKSDHLIKSLRNVYWLIKEKLPLSKFSGLQQLMKLQGVQLDALDVHGDTYSSRKTANDFLDSLFSVISNQLDEEIKESDFCSILIDESTDIAVSKKLLIYVKYLSKNFEVKTQFLANLKLVEVSVTSQVLFNEVTKYIATRSINLDKIIGFGSDGASIMTGVYYFFLKPDWSYKFKAVTRHIY